MGRLRGFGIRYALGNGAGRFHPFRFPLSRRQDRRRFCLLRDVSCCQRNDDLNKRMQAERRRSSRYRVRGDVFVRFKYRPEIIGRVSDFSTAGISFEYGAMDPIERICIAEIPWVKIDVFTWKPELLLLANLACKVVYDIEIVRPTFLGIETRRCGLRFDALSPLQTGQLKRLLDPRVLPCCLSVAGLSPLFHCMEAAGSSTVKVVPPSGPLSNEMSPP